MNATKYILTDIDKAISTQFDLLICCSSFEERCLSIPKAINKSKVLDIAICHNVDQDGDIDKHTRLLEELFNDQSHQTVELHSNDPIMVISKMQIFLNNFFTGNPQKVKILVDITTFTHESLLILFNLLLLNSNNIEQLSLCYNDAEEYSVNEENEEDKWLTKGVGDARNIIGYPGYISPARKTHLIVMFGFEVERTELIIERYEADIVSVGLGCRNNSVSESHSNINTKRHEQLVANNENINSFTFSLINPVATCEAILNQINKYPDTNIIIAPMNTKLSTIGAGIAAEKNKDIQLCYIKGNLYNRDGYSTPGKHLYIYDVSLGSYDM